MESELVSSCCSSSSPSLTSTSPEADSSWEDAAEQTELEAAEALADLAQLAIMRERVVVSAARWGSKGKRVRKRVKNETPLRDSRLKLDDSDPPVPHLIKEEAEEGGQGVSRDVATLTVKTEVDDSIPDQVLTSTIRCRSNGGGRLRHNLNEAEKEERRVRRILANRESARQTIRRRQALCEGLNRKAPDLSYENEQLKREKDRALKEFQSLEAINKHLKDQLCGSVTAMEKEAEERGKASEGETSGCAPLYIYNHHHPSRLFCWPSAAPSATCAGASAKIIMSSQGQGEVVDDSVPKVPFYIMPYPWFLPPPPHKHIHHDDHDNDDEVQPRRPLYDLNESAAETPDAQVIKQEDAPESGNGVSHLPPAHALMSFPDQKQGMVEYSNKRMVDTVAAAEARKRRKELTRLKNLNGHQFRMQV